MNTDIGQGKASILAAVAGAVVFYFATLLRIVTVELPSLESESFFEVLLLALPLALLVFPISIFFTYPLSLLLTPIYLRTPLLFSGTVFTLVGAIIGGGAFVSLCLALPKLINLSNLQYISVLGLAAPYAVTGAACAFTTWYYFYRSGAKYA